MCPTGPVSSDLRLQINLSLPYLSPQIETALTKIYQFTEISISLMPVRSRLSLNLYVYNKQHPF